MIPVEQLVSRAKEARGSATPKGPALWGTGFRPFFLLSAAAAVFLVPLWVLALMGIMPIGGSVGGTLWHAHEMLLGFAMGVVAGFLLTAVPKWTGTVALSGGALKVLVALWTLGRIAMGASAWLPPAVVAIGDLLFVPALAVALGRPLITTKNRRNWIFLALLGVMFCLNLAYHLQALGVLTLGAAEAMRGVMGLIVVMMVVVGGRIIPMFTRNGLAAEGRTFAPRSPSWVDRAAIGAVIALIPLELWASPELLGLGCLIAGGLVGLRMLGWGGSKTGGVPLLWILHAGYLWIALGLILRGVSLLIPGYIPASAALHALTAGAMGSLILGMIARVSLGHTGRPLKVKPVMSLAFGMIILCGFVRVFLPIIAPSLWLLTHQISALLWGLSYAIFLAVYTPILLAPRPDGVQG